MTFGKHIRNIFISLLSISGFIWIYQFLARRNGPLVRVVVFHDVTDADWFQQVVAHMDTEYHVVSPQDFLNGRFNQKKINILITFDDGYVSWVNICLPVLTRRNIKALFFVNSGLLDVAHERGAQAEYVRTNLLLSPRNTLSWEGVQSLHVAGHMIGGHTTNHSRLSLLSSDTVRTEIKSDKERIESKLGSQISTFAYPFGQSADITPSVSVEVKEAGYDMAFTTSPSFKRENGDTLLIPRLCLEENLSVNQLSVWLRGGYDMYAYIKKLW
jgi:peptidoglycan/xylan/chitin deacetylase (PgdA/CDA1 family)